MGRYQKSEDEIKNTITLRLKASVIKELRNINNYNQLVENLIVEYLEKSKKK